ncbi:MAG TPA: hypothetical protein VHP36_06475 [Chitinispirillaceae bacterium]|nr:hypothetical protein [Chitinispirillaceae bacterium]
METLLKEFKTELQEKLIELIWNQWCILGVQGNGNKKSSYWIDPEALILFTCSLGRREPRLFDEMLDWLNSFFGYINLQRLKSLSNTGYFTSKSVLNAIAFSIPESKWGMKINNSDKKQVDEPLFFFKDGKPMLPFGESDAVFKAHGYLRGKLLLRGYSKLFDPYNPSALLLSLRALFGTNARSEILLYLITHPGPAIVNSTQLSREIAFAQKTVQTILVNMSQSGYVQRNVLGRETMYSIRIELRDALLLNLSKPPVWLNWVNVYSFFDEVLGKLFKSDFDKLEQMLQVLELRLIIKKYIPVLNICGLKGIDFTEGPAEQDAFIDWFSKIMMKIVKRLLD